MPILLLLAVCAMEMNDASNHTASTNSKLLKIE